MVLQGSVGTWSVIRCGGGGTHTHGARAPDQTLLVPEAVVGAVSGSSVTNGLLGEG